MISGAAACVGLVLMMQPASAAPQTAVANGRVAHFHMHTGKPRSPPKPQHDPRRLPPSPAPASVPQSSVQHEWVLWISGTFFLAGLVHGIAGFGSGLTAMAILPAKLPMLDAVPIVAVFALLVCFTLAVQLRGALRNSRVWSTLPMLAGGTAIGVPIGVTLLTSADPRLLRLSLGLCMLAFVGERCLDHLGGLAHSRADEDSSGGSEDWPEISEASALPACTGSEVLLTARLAEGEVEGTRLTGCGDACSGASCGPSTRHRSLSGHRQIIKHRRRVDHPLTNFLVGIASGRNHAHAYWVADEASPSSQENTHAEASVSR